MEVPAGIGPVMGKELRFTLLRRPGRTNKETRVDAQSQAKLCQLRAQFSIKVSSLYTQTQVWVIPGHPYF